jgi:hypothetical protein
MLLVCGIVFSRSWHCWLRGRLKWPMISETEIPQQLNSCGADFTFPMPDDCYQAPGRSCGPWFRVARYGANKGKE